MSRGRDDDTPGIIGLFVFALLMIVGVPFVVMTITCVNDINRRHHVDECMKTHSAADCAKAFPP